MADTPVVSGEILRHGAYVCMQFSTADLPAISAAGIGPIVAALGFENEFEAAAPASSRSIAFLRRQGATPGAIADDGLLRAGAVLHVAAPTAQPVRDFCAETTRLLGRLAVLRVLDGIVRPKLYTGAAMNDFAYAHAVTQQPGPVMPNAFLLPLSKTVGWWKKDWMERHTYFLPRYDDHGRMRAEGHALAAAAGIPCLLRRTYKSQVEPAPEGAYDFVTYFECADADIATFHRVCSNLRDVSKNPEWAFVREGPLWHGRRVATWQDMFTASAA
jgi:hypothetical protein